MAIDYKNLAMGLIDILCDREDVTEVIILLLNKGYSKEEIKDLNNSSRNIDKVTDVLSFPMFESVLDMTADESGLVFLGSMVICSDRACEQAEEYGHSVEREAAFLAVHSVLHLLGYDHELGEQDEKVMFTKQENVLKSMGITR